MTKVGRWIGVLAFTALVSGVAYAQSPASAATVLANVQQVHANTNQLTASFRQTVTNATFKSSRISDGQLWVSKPADFRWDYLIKRKGNVVVSKSFVFDGTTLWFVDHDNKQIIQDQIGSSILPAAVSFLRGGSALSSQFTVAFATSGTYGGQGALVLELTPKQPSAQYKQLFFVIDPSNWRVKESIVIDSNGDTNAFRFYAPNLTSTVKASWFQVNPANLPTYKVVQLGSVVGAGSASTPAVLQPHAPGAGSAIPTP